MPWRVKYVQMTEREKKIAEKIYFALSPEQLKGYPVIQDLSFNIESDSWKKHSEATL